MVFAPAEKPKRAIQPLSILLLVCCAGAIAAEQQQERHALEQRVIALRQQLARDPGNVQQTLELAVTLQQLNHLVPDGGKRIPEAERLYRRALGSIGSAEAALLVRGNLGALLMSAGRPADAADELDAALAAAVGLLPRHALAGIMFNKAKALSMLGQSLLADGTYREAAESAVGQDFSSYSKALAAMDAPPADLMSAADGYARQLRRLLAPAHQSLVEPALGDDTFATAEAGTGSSNAPAWLAAASAHDLAWLQFALFKYHHQRREYSLAWEHLVVANQLQRAQESYDAANEWHTLSRVKSLFPGYQLGLGYNSTVPIFIIGLPRSGSTLVEQILASHSAVFAAGEDTALAPLTAEVNAALGQPGTDARRLWRRYGKRYVHRMRALVPPGTDPPPRRIVDKMLRNIWLVGYIDMLLPRSCILHVVRHPMDAGFSCYSQPFGYSGMPWAWDLSDIAAQINMTYDLASHWEVRLPGRILTVYYEELVQDPETVAREILDRCGLSWQPEVLNFHTTQRPVATASMSQVRQPLYRTSVGKWRRYEAQLQPLAEALGGTVASYEAALQQHLSRRRSAAAARDATARAAAVTAAAGDAPAGGSGTGVAARGGISDNGQRKGASAAAGGPIAGDSSEVGRGGLATISDPGLVTGATAATGDAPAAPGAGGKAAVASRPRDEL